MITRREFLQRSGLGIAGLSLGALNRAAQAAPAGMFAVHPFVVSNPDAVFIMRTDVDSKFNSSAKLHAGKEFAASVFLPSDNGVPVGHKIALKANLLMGKAEPPYPDGYFMGANTDAEFVEGVIEGLKSRGVSEKRFYLTDTSASKRKDMLEGSGYLDMSLRTGVNLLQVESYRSNPEWSHWVELQEPVIHKKLPYLRPFNEPDTFLLNIAKFKSHAMGLTLCCKNLQGMIANPWQGFCHGIDGPRREVDNETLVRNYEKTVEKNYKRHLKAGIPRWDRDGRYYRGGLGMETWVTRTLDNISASPLGLCVVEGIYGRDGSHISGPHPPFEGNSQLRGRAHDYMTNIILFGMNPFHVDIVGHWLGGHEPGNFGLFHIARERGMSKFLDPHTVPFYSWKDGNAEKAVLSSYDRTPLASDYLRRDYDGLNEDVYHLCNEPYDYSIQ